ncbi:MAG TPA: POTRA domain-containing protein [Candidatus Dormibacteraeota bacterium]|nr:POTRA domain-containing protein [Candidatus Dormibacteraeota bacterium]
MDEKLAEPGQVSYEGQKIAKIELVAHPTVNTEPLRGSLLVKPGDAYSAARVEASAQELRLMGRFSKVQTQVRPQVSGLILTFVMEPAAYIGMITFPGALKPFTYTRLLQVVNLANQDPYLEEQVLQADTALLRFFQANGFFLAKVAHEKQLDDAHQVANIRFQVTLGKCARFGRLEVSGPPTAESQRLAHSFRSYKAILFGAYIKPGRVYTKERVDRGQRFLAGQLGKQNHPANKVRLTARYHPDTNRADLTFDVKEGPTVSVKVSGSRLSIPFNEARTLRRLVPIYEEGAFDRDLVMEGKRNIINYFQAKGYFDATVDAEITQSSSEVQVVYEVDKGDRHKLVSVQVRGASRFDQDELLKQVAVQEAHWFSRGKLNTQLVAKSADNLKTFYRNAGFEDVQIKPNVVDREPDIEVTFQVSEGPQTIVDTVRFEGNHAFSDEVLDPPSGPGIIVGQPYSLMRVNVDRDHILARYFDQGYLNARLTSTTERHQDDSHRVDVIYHIKEGPRVHISDVVFLGAPRTRNSYLKNAAGLCPEQPLSQSRLLEAESRLYDLGILDWASAAPRRTITDQNEEMVLVKAHEAKPNTITYGFGFELARRAGLPSGTVAVPGLPPVSLGNFNAAASTEKSYLSPRGSVEYVRRNIFGLGQTGSVSARFSRLDQRGALSYATPHLRGSAWNSLFSASAERSSENPVFVARSGDAVFQVEKTLDGDRTKTLLLRYGYRRTELSQLLIPDLVQQQDRSVRLSTISSSYIRDTRDKPLDAHKGFYQTLDVGLTPKALGSSSNFVHFLGQAAYYRKVRTSTVWANSLRLGLAKPFAGSFIPLSERFFSGGATSLRGFPINGAGPQREVSVCNKPSDLKTCFPVRVPVGGNMLFILNSELRFPLGIKKGLGGVAFYDGGNVYDRISIKRWMDEYTNTIGFGLRYATPVGPVRFDIARRLNAITGISSIQYFFTIGQSF